MKTALVIVFLLVTAGALAQQQVQYVRDSIVYDASGATRKGSPCACFYFDTVIKDARIVRNVADFNRDSLGGRGWKVLVIWQDEFTLSTDSAITFFDRSGSRDTFDVYFFDKDNAPKWDTITNTHLYTPTYHVVTCGTCAGLPQTTVLTSPAGRKVQFALFVFHRTNLFSGLWPDVAKINVRGVLTGQRDTTYNLAHWAVQRWHPRKIGDISLNFNLQNQQDTLWSDTALVDYGDVRTFDIMYYDDQNVAAGSQQINAGGTGFLNGYQYQKQLASKGHYQYAAVFDDNAYFKAQLAAAGHTVNKSWGTNTITDDPQAPASYSRKGHYMHALAEAGGTCTTCPKTTAWYNGTPELNAGYLKFLGTSNEPTLFASANAYKNPIEVVAEALGVYDSVKSADPNIKVILAGFEGFNYDDAKASILLMKLYLRSRNLKIDGVDFHELHTLKLDSFPVIPNSSQQVGNYGVSVGYWDDWHKIINYHNGILRESGDTNLLAIVGEDPYQKGYYKRYPTNEGETFSISQLAAPGFTVGGVLQDRMTSQAIALLQSDMIVDASGINEHFQYSAVDDVVLSSNPGYDATDANNGEFRRPDFFGPPPTAWPAHYGRSSRVRRSKEYVFLDTVTYTRGGLAVFKYYEFSSPDSLRYEYATLDSNGTAAVDLTALDGLALMSGKEITPSFVSRTADQTTKMSNALTADPLPRSFIVYAPGTGNLPPVSSAGADQSVTLPVNSTVLSGVGSGDPDGTITAYAWSKLSGPATYTIVSPSASTTTVSNLVEGVYIFQLQVTDNDGATSTDTVIVTVYAIDSGVKIKKKNVI